MKKTIVCCFIVLLFLWALAGCSAEKVYGKGDTNIAVDVGKTFTIKLDENPTTGYSWTYTISDENIVKLVKDDYVPDDKTGKLVGSGGSRMLTFEGAAKGNADISLAYGPVYDKNTVAEQLVFHIRVQ